MQKLALGIDLGTESGRAVLVDVESGTVVATHVTPYQNGVITGTLPDSGVPLNPLAALQDPADYIRVLETSIPIVLHESGVPAEAVIGIGVSCTSSTMIAVDERLVPICEKEGFRQNPHSWVKLWKHHSTHADAEEIEELARLTPWFHRYGGKVSAEWMLPKCIETYREAPDVWQATDTFLEAGDWVAAMLTGKVTRNLCAAGYKSFYHVEDGYPPDDFFAAIRPDLGDFTRTRMRGSIQSSGSLAGRLTEEMAMRTHLLPGTAVAVAIVDAHAAVPGVGVADAGQAVLVMGTSTCHMLLGHTEESVPGVSVVKDGIIPGLFAYEGGQSAVGDIFAWFVREGVPAYLHEEAHRRDMDVYSILEEKAAALRPGESGLVALDWHNGNRTPFQDSSLSGVLVGLTLQTRPWEIYRAWIEATAYGTRNILASLRDAGLRVHGVTASGGIPLRSPLTMQIYADVLNTPISVATSPYASAVGAAMLGAVAAGAKCGGYETIAQAAAAMAEVQQDRYRPIAENVRIYEALCEEYNALQAHFGRTRNATMRRLEALRLRGGAPMN